MRPSWSKGSNDLTLAMLVRCIWPHRLRVVTKAMSERLLSRPEPTFPHSSGAIHLPGFLIHHGMSHVVS